MGEAPAMTDNIGKFLVFSLQGQRYGLDLAKVAEVGDSPRISAIPLVPACYSGALNFNGDIVAVIDLALLLGLTGNERPGKIVVLHREVSSLAFLVEMVIRIAAENELTHRMPSDNAFAAATLWLPDGDVTLLDLEAIIHEAENIIKPPKIT